MHDSTDNADKTREATTAEAAAAAYTMKPIRSSAVGLFIVSEVDKQAKTRKKSKAVTATVQNGDYQIRQR
jgi:hypothetical protein